MELGEGSGQGIDVRPTFLSLAISTVSSNGPIYVHTNIGIQSGCGLSPAAFGRIRDQLSQRLFSVAEAVAKNNQRRLRQALWAREGLAKAGSAALNELLGREDSDAIFAWGARTANRTGEVPMLLVDCPEFQLPWEVLFYTETGMFSDDGSMTGFIGVQFRVVRVLYPHSRKVYDGDSSGIGVVLDDALPGIKKEFEAVQNHAHTLGMPVQKFVDEVKSNEHMRIQKLKEFLQLREISVLHFACHAKVDPATAADSFLRVGKRLSVTITDLTAGIPLDLGAVRLLILNACDTGFSRPDEILSFVRVFALAGAKSLVVTECPIESKLAAAVADAFWQELCDADSVSRALHGISSENHSDRMRAISLAYGFYGDPYQTI